jgi:outer membrane lipoprotein SlyB
MMTTIQRALLVLGLGGVVAAAPVPALSAPAASQPTATSERLATLCSDCAIVDSVKSETRKGEGGAVGMVGGAVVGGVLGHQIGGGIGKTLATVGGAAAGAYAGNEVQKNVNKTTVWTTRVTLKDGSARSFETGANPGFRAGEVVLVDGGKLKKR